MYGVESVRKTRVGGICCSHWNRSVNFVIFLIVNIFEDILLITWILSNYVLMTLMGVISFNCVTVLWLLKISKDYWKLACFKLTDSRHALRAPMWCSSLIGAFSTNVCIIIFLHGWVASFLIHLTSGAFYQHRYVSSPESWAFTVNTGYDMTAWQSMYIWHSGYWHQLIFPALA